jgi:hypothetical protein
MKDEEINKSLLILNALFIYRNLLNS